MSNTLYLVYIPDFFGVQGTIAALFNEQGVKLSEGLPGRELEATIVSYDVVTLIDEYRKADRNLPRELVDFGDGLRLVQGQARDDGGESGWNVYKALRSHSKDKSRLKQFGDLARGRVDRPADGELEAILIAAARALSSVWNDLKVNLKECGEYERFFAVELPFQQFCWYRQWKGISVNQEVTHEFLSICRSDKYEAYLSLAEQAQVSPSGLSYRTVKNILGQTDAKHLLDIKDGQDLENEFKLAVKSSAFAKSFVRFIRSSQDEILLSRLSGVDGRVFPTFQPLGTVTGRTLIADPYLQNTRRKYRRVLSAEKGMTLIYLDYSQFEPGICAFLANDKKLIEDYNAGDLYSNLSKSIFSSTDCRAEAKRVFISYLYGMTLENIAKLLSPNGNSNESKKHKDAISTFFNAYQGLQKFRTDSAQILLNNGKIGTLLGNFRYRKLSGELTFKEQRWAANQRVQGTASLILKEAIIALVKKFGIDAFIIPIHDAVLLQVQEAEAERITADAIEIMEDAFVKRCPSIIARVNAGQFDG